MIAPIILSVIYLGVYLLFSGSASIYDIITGLAISIPLGAVSSRYLVSDERKLLELKRLLYAVIYFIKYMTIIELKAHMDVIKRIFTLDIKPGIVRVPLTSRTAYGRLLVACSITNTPGTVVVDEKDGYFYVNWIYVSTTEPLGARAQISEEFEQYSHEIFE